jgi:hypothetical protein
MTSGSCAVVSTPSVATATSRTSRTRSKDCEAAQPETVRASNRVGKGCTNACKRNEAELTLFVVNLPTVQRGATASYSVVLTRRRSAHLTTTGSAGTCTSRTPCTCHLRAKTSRLGVGGGARSCAALVEKVEGSTAYSCLMSIPVSLSLFDLPSCRQDQAPPPLLHNYKQDTAASTPVRHTVALSTSSYLFLTSPLLLCLDG